MRSLRIVLRGAAMQVLGAIVIAGGQVQAQGVDLVGDRGPRFLLASSSADGLTVPVNVRETAVLRRLVRLDLDNATIKSALTALTQQSGVDLVYSDDVLPGDVRVTLRAQGIAVAAALTHILLDARVDVVFLANGTATLRRQAAPLQVGAITGQVTDSLTNHGIFRATVSVQGTTLSTLTDAEGRFTIRQVPVGDRVVSVKFLGYTAAARSVRVGENETATVTFLLVRAPTTLDQVVSTATGERRYRELGHVVARINADSLVKSAPITTLAELLTARVPGLQVLSSNGGMAGGEVALRLRGQTTRYLDAQPIIIVDGVRYKSSNSYGDRYGNVRQDARPFDVEQRSPLHDLNVNDIESVDVVKGPSASTLYGPDASNGVIVITTKRGKVGKPVWNLYAYPNLSFQSKQSGDISPTDWWGWGHDPSTGQTVPFSCRMIDQYQYNSCVLDSIRVVPTAAGNPDLQVLSRSRPQWQSGASVSGGVEAIQYFFSSNYDSQVGSLRIPPAVAAALRSRLGAQALSDVLRTPNTQQTLSLNSNIVVTPTPRLTLGLSATYSQSAQRSISARVFQDLNAYGPLLRDSASVAVNLLNLGSAFLQTSQQRARRLVGSFTAEARPAEWLTLSGTAGLDFGGTVDRGILPENYFEGEAAHVRDYRRDNIGRTMNLSATTLTHRGPLSFRTSLGVQYAYAHLDGVDIDAYNLAPGSTSLTTATELQGGQLWSESASLGTYGEEVIGLNDRLYLTASLRVDGSSSFGDAYRPRPYPKVGVSWIASDEPFLRNVPGLGELRFRYSFGAASRYPMSAMKLGVVEAQQHSIEGRDANTFDRSQLANPRLRPERTRESEYGLDATLVGNVQVGLTWYRKRSNDQLQLLENSPGLGRSWGNVGDVAARGFEATINSTVLDRPLATITLQFTYSYNTDKILSLGDADPFHDPRGSFVVGYPSNAAFGTPVIGVADTVGGRADGIIFPEEVVLDSENRFLGVLFPPRVYTFTPAASLFHGRVRVSSLFDRQAGSVQQDWATAVSANQGGQSLALLDKETPVLVQAKFIGGSEADFLVPADFTRWRELTVATDLPERFVRLVRLSRATVNFQVRNLAIWTDYYGSDPENQPGVGLPGGQKSGASGIPLARTWGLSFNVTP